MSYGRVAGEAERSVPVLGADHVLRVRSQTWRHLADYCGERPYAPEHVRMEQLGHEIAEAGRTGASDDALFEVANAVLDEVEKAIAVGKNQTAVNHTKILNGLWWHKVTDSSQQSQGQHPVRRAIEQRYHTAYNQRTRNVSEANGTLDYYSVLAEKLSLTAPIEMKPIATQPNHNGDSKYNKRSMGAKAALIGITATSLIGSMTQPAAAASMAPEQTTGTGPTLQGARIASAKLVQEVSNKAVVATADLLETVSGASQSVAAQAKQVITGQAPQYDRMMSLPAQVPPLETAAEVVTDPTAEALLQGSMKDAVLLEPPVPVIDEARPVTKADLDQARQSSDQAVYEVLRTEAVAAGLQPTASPLMEQGVDRLASNVRVDRIEQGAIDNASQTRVNDQLAIARLSAEFGDQLFTVENAPLITQIIADQIAPSTPGSATEQLSPYISGQLNLLNGQASGGEYESLSPETMERVAQALAAATSDGKTDEQMVDIIEEADVAGQFDPDQPVEMPEAQTPSAGRPETKAPKTADDTKRPRADIKKPKVEQQKSPRAEKQMSHDKAVMKALDKMEKMGPSWKNRAIAMRHFIKNGDPDYVAAAFVGNFIVEAGDETLDPQSYQGNGGEGRGIAQWTESERWQALLAFAEKQGLNPWKIKTQLKFVTEELATTEGRSRGILDGIIKGSDGNKLEAATRSIVDDYERAGVDHFDRRIAGARETLNMLQKLTNQVKNVSNQTAGPSKKVRAFTSGEAFAKEYIKRHGKDNSGRLSANELQKIGPDLLSPTTGNQHELIPDAARTMAMMARAFRKQFGKQLEITDSYRSFEEQEKMWNDPKKRTADGGCLCAVAGKSNHGYGMAVDVGSGVNSWGTPEHKWFVENAPRFGWTHPDWAHQDGSKPEAWHFEYVGGRVAVGEADRARKPGGDNQQIKAKKLKPEQGNNGSSEMPISKRGYTTPIDPELYVQLVPQGTSYDGYQNIPGVHTGLDVPAKFVPFRAAMGGTVVQIGEIGLGIHAITVKQLDGKYGVYQHIAPGSARIRVGDNVQTGQTLGRTGNSGAASGASTGPHLHFSVQRQQAIVSKSDSNVYETTDNPMDYLPSVKKVQKWLDNRKKQQSKPQRDQQTMNHQQQKAQQPQKPRHSQPGERPNVNKPKGMPSKKAEALLAGLLADEVNLDLSPQAEPAFADQ